MHRATHDNAGESECRLRFQSFLGVQRYENLPTTLDVSGFLNRWYPLGQSAVIAAFQETARDLVGMPSATSRPF